MAGSADLGERSWVGSRVRHVEDPKFLKGQATYTDDLKLPGVLHTAFVRSTHAHAHIIDVDTSRARALPGVVAVLTAADITEDGTGIVAESTNPTYQQTVQELLASTKVRMVGDPIAAVVAEDRYLAEDGVDAVQVTYDPIPPVTSIDSALSDQAPLIHDEAAGNVHMSFHKCDGDVQGAFATADLTLDLEFRTQRYSAVCMEPRASVARYDEASDEMTWWVSTQTPHLFRSVLAQLLGMSEHKIRVIADAVGGGFGQKHVLHPDEVMVPLLARKLRRPIKWTSDRREDLQVSAHAREQVHKVSAAVTRDGMVTAIRDHIYADTGAYSVWPVSAGLEMGQAADNVPGPYLVPAYERIATSVITNKAPVGPYRGVGRPHGCMVHERVMDEVASALDLDPREVRLRNFIPTLPHTTSGGFRLDSGDFAATLQRTLDGIEYDKLRLEHADLADQGVYRGVGIAFNIEQSAHGMKEWERKGVVYEAGYDTAEMRVEPDGHVRLAVGLHNHGQGQETTMAQIAADQLGLDVDDIKVVFGDTGQVPYGFGSYSSRGTVYCGGATILAAREIREKARKIAAHLLEADPDDLELHDRQFRVKGVADRAVGWEEIANVANHRGGRLPSDMEPGLDSTKKYRANEWGSYSNACHAVVVEVDPETGEVSILKYVVVEDAGPIVNPIGADGQIIGGVAQGIGGTFLEELRYDDSGQLISGSFMDYLLPGFMEVPEVEIHHLETPSPINVGGFKGMGEGGCIATAPAIANAVIDALKPFGKATINDTPITRELVLNVLDELRTGKEAD